MQFNELTLGAAFTIGILTNFCGKWLSEKHPNIPRLVWWFGILIPFGASHLLMLNEPAFIRMIGLCTVLLLTMKALIYMEWIKTGERPMTLLRWLAFSFLWFGMQPKPWLGIRRKLEWVGHLRAGLLSIVTGAIGFTLYVAWEGTYFPLAFIFLSLLFHYGILRLNTTFWRAMGFPVRTLFRNPLTITSFREFWGTRWNLAYSQMMARAVQKPLVSKFGKRGAVFSVFVISGLFHELAITIPIMKGFGLPTLFFLFHGIAVLLERTNHRLIGILCLLSLLLGLPILFPPAFVNQVIEPVEEFWKIGLSTFY